MEIRSKLLRIDGGLHQWFKTEAKKQGRSVNSEMIAGLKYWKETRDTMALYMPEEKDLNIGIKDVESDRRIIRHYEDQIEDFEAKAAASTGARKGAYQGHITKTKRSLDATSGNLAYHLDWLKRYRPEIHKEVME